MLKRSNLLLRNGLTFLFCCCLVAISPLSAQETPVYTEPLEFYKKAQEYYRWGNYPLAQQNFNDALRFHSENEKLSPFQEMNASYYAAACAKHLAKEDAVYMLTNFIEEYGNNRRFNSLANYHLADLFFKSRRYREALACMDEVFEDDIEYDDYENHKFMQAYSHFVLEEFAEAQSLFQKVANMRGEHYHDASYYVGYLAFEEGEYQTAVDNFLIIEDLDRYKKILPYYITQIYYRTNQEDKLLDYTAPKLKVSGLKYKSQMHKMVGLVYYDRKDFGQALPYLDYFVSHSTKVSKEDLYLLAYTQYQYGQYDKAIGNFLELNTLEDEYGQNAMYHLADCYLKVNDKERARNAFRAAADLDIDAEIKRKSAFNFAKLSFELGFNTEATTGLKDFINDYPSAPETSAAKTLLGQLFEVSKNYTDAIEIIESIPNKTNELKRSYQRIAFAKAIELNTGGKNQEALQYFDKSLIYPLDRQLLSLTHFWKGNIFYDQKNMTNAIDEMSVYINSPGGATDKANPAVANYTIAYAYFSQKKYQSAKPYFEKAIAAFERSSAGNGEDKEKMYPDAILRSGDCSFIKRDYKTAKSSYDRITKIGGGDQDYALYQMGMIAGLQQNYDEKIKILKKIGQKYPDSYFSDDALFQIANTQSIQGDYQAGIKTYKNLVKKYPKSKYKSQALVDLGLMYYNIGDYDSAIATYDKVVKQYPNSQQAQDAVFNLKEVYIATGDSDAYIDYLGGNEGFEISTSGKDTILYQFAESFYEKGDCSKAIREFNKYLTEHPRGAYVTFAHFYRGDCLYQSRNYGPARTDFDFVIKQPNNLFSEKALMRGARIAFVIDKNDNKAYQYYKKLYGIASQPEITTEALKGITKSAYNLGKTSDVKKYGNLLLKDRRATKQDILETNFILAKIDYKSGALDNALKTFERVAQQSTNEAGAEARYLVAEILYKRGRYDAAKEACFRVDRETPAQEYWVVKSYILLGDIFGKKGDLYQAKATLKSIVENYEGDRKLLEDARQKLDRIVAEEKSKSKLEEEGVDNGGLDLDEDN